MKTYTLYLKNGDEPPSAFEPALCRTDAEALGVARSVLERRPEFDTVEVCFGETLLFSVARP
ncbi:MAG: hypothetical protein P4L73_12105 [Caulobacteraceae bacterium]|nr:hypothetical protein [Caulobacteraceae bacterium]